MYKANHTIESVHAEYHALWYSDPVGSPVKTAAFFERTK